LSAPRYDLEAVQDFYNFRSASVVEKDLEVIKVLQIFSALKVDGLRFVFAGGTCLSRAHRLVKRMSEDLDIKIVFSPALAAASGSRQRKALKALKVRLLEEFGKVGLHLDETDEEALKARNDNRCVEYKLTYDRRTYDASVLDPRIKVETVVSALRCNVVMKSVSSLAAEAYQNPHEVPEVACIAVEETAAEKIVSLTRRVAAKLEGDHDRFDNRIIRHVYDLHMIRNSINVAEVAVLAREIVEQDAKQFANQHPAYVADPETATRRALEALTNDPSYEEEYTRFVTEMVYGDPVSFREAMNTVSGIAGTVWGWRPSQP
jgi:predicted nucleotidyltransferase component of viral defense system